MYLFVQTFNSSGVDLKSQKKVCIYAFVSACAYVFSYVIDYKHLSGTFMKEQLEKNENRPW